MLNYPLIKARFDKLSVQERRLLLSKLFGSAKQGIAYFNKRKSPSLNKLEILADFYGVPIDTLRTDCKFLFFPASIPIDPIEEPKVKKVKPEVKIEKPEVKTPRSNKKRIAELSQQLDVYWKQHNVTHER